MPPSLKRKFNALSTNDQFGVVDDLLEKLIATTTSEHRFDQLACVKSALNFLYDAYTRQECAILPMVGLKLALDNIRGRRQCHDDTSLSLAGCLLDRIYNRARIDVMRQVWDFASMLKNLQSEYETSALNYCASEGNFNNFFTGIVDDVSFSI